MDQRLVHGKLSQILAKLPKAYFITNNIGYSCILNTSGFCFLFVWFGFFFFFLKQSTCLSARQRENQNGYSLGEADLRKDNLEGARAHVAFSSLEFVNQIHRFTPVRNGQRYGRR